MIEALAALSLLAAAMSDKGGRDPRQIYLGQALELREIYATVLARVRSGEGLGDLVEGMASDLLSMDNLELDIDLEGLGPARGALISSLADMQRQADAGRPLASLPLLALDRLNSWVRAAGGALGSSWILKFSEGVTGPVLVSARLPGEGIVRQGDDIPGYVRDYVCSDDRGVISDPSAIEAIRTGLDASGEMVVDIPEPHAPATSSSVYGPAPALDWDDAQYLGDGTDGVYYGALFSGGTWWAMATVDSDTGGFVDTLAAEGGYEDEASALVAARDAAEEWCANNDVTTS